MGDVVVTVATKLVLMLDKQVYELIALPASQEVAVACQVGDGHLDPTNSDI